MLTICHRFARKNSLRKHLERCQHALHVVPNTRPLHPDEPESESDCFPDHISSERSQIAENSHPGDLPQGRRRLEQEDGSPMVSRGEQEQPSSTWMNQGSSHATWPIQSQTSTANMELPVGVVDYGGSFSETSQVSRTQSAHTFTAVVANHQIAPMGRFPSSQGIQTMHEPNPSRIFVPEQGNPGIATMNINAIPPSYLPGSQADHQHQGTAHTPGIVVSPAQQPRIQDYTAQDDTCMSATSSFRGLEAEESCLSPHSTHSTATSFCDVSSPDTSGRFEPYYYTHQAPQQAVPTPSAMSFGPLMVEAQHDGNNGFAMANYQYNLYL